MKQGQIKIPEKVKNGQNPKRLRLHISFISTTNRKKKTNQETFAYKRRHKFMQIFRGKGRIRKEECEKKQRKKQIFLMKKVMLNIEEKQNIKPRSNLETDSRSSIIEH